MRKKSKLTRERHREELIATILMLGGRTSDTHWRRRTRMVPHSYTVFDYVRRRGVLVHIYATTADLTMTGGLENKYPDERQKSFHAAKTRLLKLMTEE